MKLMPDLDTPEITALRQAIRACLLAGNGHEGLVDILATEYALLAQEQRAAGVPTPPGFDERWTYTTEQREAAQRLAALEGTMPQLRMVRQRKMW
jgi:hypothetical protein